MKVEHLLLKNLLILSVSFLLNYTAYTSMAYLQSSINPKIGTNSLSIYYVAIVLGCIFLPSLLISNLGTQKTMGFTMLCYSTYIAAQFYPRSYTLYPTAAFLGAGSGPLWIAKGTYIAKIARQYAIIAGKSTDVIITRFFGIFFMIYQSAGIIGNIISSTVLSLDAEMVLENDTDRLRFCGKNFCSNEQKSNSSIDLEREVSDSQRYTMSAIYLTCSILGSCTIFLFLDPLERFSDLLDGNSNVRDSKDENSNNKGLKSGKSSVKTGSIFPIFYQMRNKYQLLIIPLTLWAGVEQAFLMADFTASYVACGLGVHMIGYIIICHGISDVFWSISFGPIVQRIGRRAVFLFGAAVNVLHIATLYFWSPNPGHIWPFFLFVATWGMTNAIWQTQVNALYGILFPNSSSAAFSNHRLWKSVGCIIAYILSGHVCTNIKIFVLCFFLFVAMLGYLTIEVMISRKRTKTETGDKLLEGVRPS